MSSPLIKLTADGSHTLFVPELNEHYHSVHGAVAESQHIFIEHGFRVAAKNKRALNILEIGFGTGLNALLTVRESESLKIQVTYDTLEPFPLPPDVWMQLNYASQPGQESSSRIFSELHYTAWNQPLSITPEFTIHKICKELQTFNPAGIRYDLIYFDAFAPEVHPELWTPVIFEKLATMSRPGTILVTYSAKGAVKRALTANGFIVRRLPGPAGKRHILQATYH